MGAVEDVVFGFGFGVCLCFGDTAFDRQDIVAAESEELVYAGGKLLHVKGVLACAEVFNVVEIASNGLLQ